MCECAKCVYIDLNKQEKICVSCGKVEEKLPREANTAIGDLVSMFFKKENRNEYEGYRDLPRGYRATA